MAPERSQGPDDDEARARLTALHDRLLHSLTLPVDRVQEALDDAVRRGRMTRRDAEELVQALVVAGRSQTEQLVSEIESVLGVAATRRAVRAGSERVLREVGDAARKAVAPLAPSSFPIADYDDLTAAQVRGRLDGLTRAELRKVRDYEARTANRKSVLGAIDSALR